MNRITTQRECHYSPASLFLQLATGNLTPACSWKSRRFRLKFLLRTLVWPVTTLRYLHQLSSLPDLPQLLAVQGLLPVKLHRPYLQAGFSVAQRAHAIISHYGQLARLDNLTLKQLLQSPKEVLLARLSGKEGQEFLIQCCPGRFDREGEVTLELRYQAQLIASLSFTLMMKDQQPTLFIGGLQGPRKTISSDIIRDATKAAHGLFPKRLLLETVFILAAHCEVKNIIASGDSTHVFRHWRYRHSKEGHFFASYSEFWLSVGGEACKDGLFRLPSSIPRKSLESIASKKRAEYRRRYDLLDMLTQQVNRASGVEPPEQAVA